MNPLQSVKYALNIQSAFPMLISRQVLLSRRLFNRKESNWIIIPTTRTGILHPGPSPQDSHTALPAGFLLQELHSVHMLPTLMLGLNKGFRLGSSSAEARPSLAMMMMRVKKPITPRIRSIKILCFSVNVLLLGPKRFLVRRRTTKIINKTQKQMRFKQTSQNVSNI